jgi:XTP/dITP diphosphohydrolase
MKNKRLLYLASKNPDKLAELQALINSSRWDIRLATDLDKNISWQETGKTFEENALIKARAVKKYTAAAVLGDDSGLEVKILNNEPGVFSSRYAGKEGDMASNKKKLLEALSGMSFEKRSARFVCSLAFIDEKNVEEIFTGTVNGIILDQPRGTGGFGYDPLFYYEPLKKTFAELTSEEKNEVSHRSNALRLWLKEQ